MCKWLGHPTIHALKQVMKNLDHIFNVNKHIITDFCSACQFGKSHMQHFPFIKTTQHNP